VKDGEVFNHGMVTKQREKTNLINPKNTTRYHYGKIRIMLHLRRFGHHFHPFWVKMKVKIFQCETQIVKINSAESETQISMCWIRSKNLKNEMRDMTWQNA